MGILIDNNNKEMLNNNKKKKKTARLSINSLEENNVI